MLQFDYSKLLGRIKEYGYTQEDVAKAIGINKGTLNAKLNNKNSFTINESANICRLLDISKHEIGAFFYAEKV